MEIRFRYCLVNCRAIYNRLLDFTENINTHNPIKINAIEYQRISKYISRSKSWKEIWYSIFGTPESQPARLHQIK